jgi:hypothetical protein
MRKILLKWQTCRLCNHHIPGNMEDLRRHLAEKHDNNWWFFSEDDVRQEFKFELEKKEVAQ